VTVEHKIVVSLNDIKAVIFECRQCRTRVSMLPDAMRIPQQCPNGNCESREWITGIPAPVVSSYEDSTAKYVSFVQALGHIRKKNNDAAFRILLEFDDSETIPTEVSSG
jgi:hypothetical protein